jgi:DivIVA domain-containing protein
MHLTPEQIDRQPFRMRRRGYDIVQVRDFLREISAEMRSRQEVRERLAENGGDSAIAEDRAHSIIHEAQAKADAIIAEAEAAAGSVDALLTAEARAVEVVGSAEGLSAQMIEEAEATARSRSDAVLAATQARLDQLLQEERTLDAKLHEMRREIDGPEQHTVSTDARDVVEVDRVQDSSFAEFVKSTLRDEVHPD